MFEKKILLITLSVFNGCLMLCSQNPDQKAHCRNNLFNSLVANTLSNSVPVIDVDALHANKTHYLILDARELTEYEVSHIEGAIHIGHKSPDLSRLTSKRKNQPIAVYCSIGYRSEKMAKQLLELGFTNVVNVYGSIFEWVNRDYPIVDHRNCETLVVHGYSRSWSIWISNDKYKVVYK